MYFDTRFELDARMDADSDTTDMELVDGGLTSTASPGIGQIDQRAEWESRIHRQPDPDDEAHYWDFLIHVPEGETDEYLGMVAGGQSWELHIFGGYYKLWDVSQSQYAGTQYNAPGGSTAGWRNIGLCGADVVGNGGTYIDGVKATGATTDWGLALNPLVKFGTLASSSGPGIKLYEQLTYIRSFHRAWANGCARMAANTTECETLTEPGKRTSACRAG